MNKPQPGEKYRHYKSTGGSDHTYEVVALAKDSDDLSDLVVYRALYASDDFPEGQVWCRSLDNFTEEIERKDYDYSGPRFTPLA